MVALFQRNFAQLHVRLPGMDVPIFIGEILIAICLALMIVKVWAEGTSLRKRWHAFAAIYVVWVLIKAWSGYQLTGAFALRNAAMFYYPVFIVIGYYLYDREVLRNLAWPVLIIGIATKFFTHYNNFFIYPYWMLSFVLLRKIRQPWLRLLMLVPVLYLPEYHFNLPDQQWVPLVFLLQGSRARVLGHLCAFVFVCVFFLYATRWVSGRIKLISFGVLLIILAVGLGKFADQNALKSVTSVNKIVALYKEYDEGIQQRAKYFQFAPIPPKTYSKEQKDFTRTVDDAKTRMFNRSEYEEDYQAFLNEAVETRRAHSAKMEAEISELEKRFALRIKELIESGADAALIREFEIKAREKIIELRNQTDLTVRNEINDLAKAMGIDTFFTTEEVITLGNDSRAFRDLSAAYNNIFFRLFVWRDMVDDLAENHQWVLGMSFGHPQRSKSLEILTWASGEWSRDGWIAPHNSFLHIVYRAGLLGVFFVLAIFLFLIRAVVYAFKARSTVVALTVSVLIYWAVVAMFSLFLEMPYLAIPCWSLVGMLWAYADGYRNARMSSAVQR